MSLTLKKTCSTPLLVGGDWNHGIWWLSIQLGIKNHPNWRTPSFFRGVGIPPTSYRLMAFPPRDLSKHRVEGPYGNRGPVSSAGPWRAHESSSSAESGWGWWFVAGLRTRPLGPLGPLGLCRRFPRASEDGKWCRKKSDNFGATFCSDFFFRRNQMGYRSPLICGTDAERWGFKLLDFGVIRWEKWVDETSKLVVETVETARTATSRKNVPEKIWSLEDPKLNELGIIANHPTFYWIPTTWPANIWWWDWWVFTCTGKNTWDWGHSLRLSIQMTQDMCDSWSGWWFGTWIDDFPIYWECHHPNWRTPSFFRGVGIPPTSDIWTWPRQLRVFKTWNPRKKRPGIQGSVLIGY